VGRRCGEPWHERPHDQVVRHLRQRQLTSASPFPPWRVLGMTGKRRRLAGCSFLHGGWDTRPEGASSARSRPMSTWIGASHAPWCVDRWAPRWPGRPPTLVVCGSGWRRALH
jgi:hypothetical protein